MTKRNNYNYKYPPLDQEIIEKLSNPNYEGNILISETAPVEEKMKYSVSQSILTYQQESKKTFATLVKEIEIQNLTVKNLKKKLVFVLRKFIKNMFINLVNLVKNYCQKLISNLFTKKSLFALVLFYQSPFYHRSFPRIPHREFLFSPVHLLTKWNL